MHLVWPALGATAAVLVCLMASAGVMQATNEQRPDSLAGVIGYLASPGSNVNPARMDGFTAVPRRYECDHWPVGSGDAVLALSAVVTREGYHCWTTKRPYQIAPPGCIGLSTAPSTVCRGGRAPQNSGNAAPHLQR